MTPRVRSRGLNNEKNCAIVSDDMVQTWDQPCQLDNLSGMVVGHDAPEVALSYSACMKAQVDAHGHVCHELKLRRRVMYLCPHRHELTPSPRR